MCVWSWNAYEYTWVLIGYPIHQLQSQYRSEWMHCNVMHPIQYITYVQYMCTEPIAVRPYTSGLYTVVLQWLLGVQYYCMHLSAHLLSITVQVRMNTLQCHASHLLHTYMCTEPIAVRPYMSGLYTGVWSLPNWVCGLVQMDTCYHCSTQLSSLSAN